MTDISNSKAPTLSKGSKIPLSTISHSPLLLLFIAALFASAAFTQQVKAECLGTNNTVVCTGQSHSDNLPLAEVTSGGSIVNNGDSFVTGRASYVFFGNGDNISLTNNGTITTTGNAADAMETVGNDNTITNNGVVSTSGVSPDALRAVGNRNTLVNAGHIHSMVPGDATRGIVGQGHNNKLVNSGSIVMEGAGADGMRVEGDGNRLVNSGSLAVSGRVANGIRTHGDNNIILNTGSITTSGQPYSGVAAAGILVNLGTNNLVINRGTIRVEQAHNAGVWIPSKAGQTATLINDVNGIIESRINKALDFWEGDERVENYGRIANLDSQFDNDVAADLKGGRDYFLIGATSQIQGVVLGGHGYDTFALGGSVNASFDAALIGASAKYRFFETYDKVGPSTWVVTGSNNDAMPWNVREGSLLVTGSIGGSAMIVHDGATLGGTGTVGRIAAGSGSTLSPGVNGIASLAVTGNVLIANGATYRIDLDADRNSDRIVAQGSATVEGGTVRVNALPGHYTPGARWTILTANGGVTGQFSKAVTNLAFFRPVLTKDGQNIYLLLPRVDRPLPGNRPVVDPFLPVTEDELPTVLDLTSGEAIVSATGTILAHDDLFRGAVLCRLRCASTGLPSFAAYGATIADYAADLTVSKGSAAPLVPIHDWTLWAKAIASWGSTDATAASHALERSTGGLVFGLDGGFGTPYRLGLAAGYFSTDLSVPTLNSSGAVESLHIGGYGSASFGAFNLRGGVAYAHHEVGMTRSIAFTGFSGTMRSDSSVDSVQAFGELGSTILLNDRVALEPFLGLAHVHIASRGVIEDDPELAVGGRVHAFDTTYTTLGARLIATLPTQAGELTFKGLLGWRHAFGDLVPKATFSYAGDGRPFSVAGAPIDRDSLVVEAGVNWEVARNVTLGVSYSGAIGARDQEHAFRGTLSISF